MKIFKKLLLTTLFLLITLEIFSDKTADDKLIILPNTYGWIENDHINIPVRAWIFEQEEDSFLRKNLIESLKEFCDNADDEEKINFERRVRYFTVDNKRGKSVNINLSGENFTLPETSPNGHTYSVIQIRNHFKTDQNVKQLNFSGFTGSSNGKTFKGIVSVLNNKGYSIISDIDDTIKISNVLDKKELIKNTFLRKFTPIDGMPELYRKLEKRGFAFHYISGSPWQLYPEINKFLQEEHFPPGSVELKLFRLKDSSFINFLTADQLDYKINAATTIIGRFPDRKFILIGDSGEKDPEVYSEIAHRYSNRISYIFIRDAGLIRGNELRLKSIKEKAGNVKVIIFINPRELDTYIKNI